MKKKILLLMLCLVKTSLVLSMTNIVKYTMGREHNVISSGESREALVSFLVEKIDKQNERILALQEENLRIKKELSQTKSLAQNAVREPYGLPLYK